MAWKEAARYTTENKKEIVYDRRPIIELEKPQRTYRASRGKAHTQTGQLKNIRNGMEKKPLTGNR